MWRSAIIIFLLIVSSSIRSQIIISNLSLADTTKNIFYLGVENKIHITGKDYDPVNGKLAVSGGACILKKIEKGSYVLLCGAETDDCMMWYSEKGQLVFKQKFICRTINSEVTVKYGGIKDSIASVNQLLANPFLYIDLPGSYYKHNYYITSFNAIFISQDLDSLKTNSLGSLLTNEQKEIIKKLKPRDKIFFDEIYGLSPDGRRRKLKSFTITIR
jgi:hypothetical protein